MLKKIIQLLCQCSASFNLDILWRIVQLLSLKECRILTSRLLCQESEQVTFQRQGIIWTTPTKDETIFPNLFAYGQYQGLEIKNIIQWMTNQDRLHKNQNVIIDIGANIGSTCIPFALQTHCHVIAIEPYPPIFKLLQQNVRQNNLQSRITCVQKAVFNRSGFVEMIMCADNLGNIQILRPESKIHFSNENDQVRDHIPSEPLMDILRKCGIKKDAICFVWSDTEGCEVEVIQTGAPLWEAGIPIYLEIQPRLLHIQNNMASFKELIPKYFDRFMTRSDLIQLCERAPVQSIKTLPELTEQLNRNKSDTDVLLLPKTFQLKKH